MDAVGQALTALEQEERDLAARLEQVRAAVAAIRGVVGSPGRHSQNGTAPKTAGAASTTWIDRIYAVLHDARRPLHMSEILDELGRRGSPVRDRKKARDIVSGALTRKARKRETFSHVGPGTFGLLEWGKTNGKPRSHHKQTVSPSPVNRESTTTAQLLDVIARNQGKTATEIVSIYEQQSDESPEYAEAKRASRVTRLGQLAERGRVRREDGKYFMP